jgi:predicted Fe-Mo cluster-binding NifX family protein
MRLALGTDDKCTLRRELFGDSVYFCIVNIENNVASTVEFRENIHADPHIPDKPPRILNFLNDCDVFISRSLRKGSFKLFAENGKHAIVTSHELIETAVRAFASGDFGMFKRYDLEDDGFIQMTSALQ